MERYDTHGIRLARTDEAGAITVDIGEKATATAYRDVRRRYWQ